MCSDAATDRKGEMSPRGQKQDHNKSVEYLIAHSGPASHFFQFNFVSKKVKRVLHETNNLCFLIPNKLGLVPTLIIIGKAK